MSKAGFLLDINVLVALVDAWHVHHSKVVDWFDSIAGQPWSVCAFTEAGFLRVMARPTTGILSISEASEVLHRLSQRPGYEFWPLLEGWPKVESRFKGRVFGHQQITDAFLLGLAVQHSGVLVTFDKATRHLAGAQYSDYLLVLE